MIKLLHISDIHLGAKLGFLGDKAKSQREQIWRSLEKSFDSAVKNKADLVVITGDVFDTPFPGEPSIQRFSTLSQKLAAAGVYCVILPGNHDRLEAGSVWAEYAANSSLEKYLHILRPSEQGSQQPCHLYLPDLSINIFGKPCLTQKSKQSTLLGVADTLVEVKRQQQERSIAIKADIVLAHGSLEVAGKTAENYPVLKTDLQKLGELGVAYVALGDWHGQLDASVAITNGESKKLTAAYPGSLEVIDRAQKNAGFGIWAEIESGKETKLTTERLSELQIVELEFNLAQLEFSQAEAELSKLAKSAKAQQTIVYTTFSGQTHLAEGGINLSALEEEFLGKFFSLKLKDSTDLQVTQTDLQRYPEGSIPHQFILGVQAKVEAGELSAELAQRVIQLGINTIHANQT